MNSNEDNDDARSNVFRAFKGVRVIVICGALSVYGTYDVDYNEVT